MSYSLHPEVERDISEAAEHLERYGSPKTAARFVTEFEQVANLLVNHPGLGTPMSRGRRIYPFKVFKYSVVYRHEEEGVRILVVRHRRRRPGYGERRT